MEKEREKDGENQENKEEVVYDVYIRLNHREVRLEKGATLQDLIDELIRQGLTREELATLTIMLDSRAIRYDPEIGKLSENPILSLRGILSLIGKIKGGNS